MLLFFEVTSTSFNKYFAIIIITTQIQKKGVNRSTTIKNKRISNPSYHFEDNFIYYMRFPRVFQDFWYVVT